MFHIFQVRYRIVGGSAASNFSLDSVRGELRPNGLIDYESMDPSSSIKSENNEDPNTRVFELVIRAYDLGNPSLYSDVPVSVFVTDVNDHAPVFQSDPYLVSLKEDAQGGTQVIKVRFIMQYLLYSTIQHAYMTQKVKKGSSILLHIVHKN